MIPILNPYEELFRELSAGEGFDQARVRKRLVAAYAFAVPNRDALEAIAAEGPVIELGAGTGYWAWLLRQLGVSVEAYDRNAGAPPSWSRVVTGDPVSVFSGPASPAHARAVLLCWPPLESELGLESGGRSLGEATLEFYRGDTLHFVGEWRGRTGTPAFFDRLENEWTLVRTVAIPQWPGFHDELQTWRRRV